MAQLAMLLLLLLTACETAQTIPKFEVSVSYPELEPIPEWMADQCPPLPKINKKGLSQAEAEAQWARDMRLYHECRTKHAALSRWVQQRDTTFRRKVRQ